MTQGHPAGVSLINRAESQPAYRRSLAGLLGNGEADGSKKARIILTCTTPGGQLKGGLVDGRAVRGN